MEFHPGGLLLIALIVFLIIFCAAALFTEVLVLTKVIKKSGWPLRIFFTVVFCIIAWCIFITPGRPSANDIISVTTPAQNCNSIDKDKLTGSWEHWNISHAKKDTISFRKDGICSWSGRPYTGWDVFCDTLVVKNKNNTPDSFKLLTVNQTNLLFRLSSSTGTGWDFSATRIESKPQ